MIEAKIITLSDVIINICKGNVFNSFIIKARIAKLDKVDSSSNKVRDREGYCIMKKKKKSKFIKRTWQS